ncbi:hypothetical protein [Pelagibacterium montanilacus]|uniref:hypothetical protein n=1 Tax=Pelagibacterium montanilacus TaxID=2185280 RepID=UPI000F8C318C|nr:hypothetical protein [Pelagibacterium montanilacus]
MRPIRTLHGLRFGDLRGCSGVGISRANGPGLAVGAPDAAPDYRYGQQIPGTGRARDGWQLCELAGLLARTRWAGPFGALGPSVPMIVRMLHVHMALGTADSFLDEINVCHDHVELLKLFDVILVFRK